jgi:olefin beta-lactone synthetase
VQGVRRDLESVFAELVAAPLRRIAIKPSVSGYRAYKPDMDVFSTENDHAALITFTTGSTGTPKAALRSHDFLRRQFDVLREELNPQPGEVNMTVLPIVLLINLGAGAGSVIAKFKASKPDTLDAGAVVRQLVQYKVQRLTASPFFIRRVAEYCIAQNAQVPELKAIFTGGAPVFPAEAAVFTRAFQRTNIQIAYGSTEAEPISLIPAVEVALNVEKAQPEALPVGQVNTHIDLKIIPITDEPIDWTTDKPLQTLPEGEIGEIIVAGPHVLASYYNNPEALRRQKIYAPDGSVWHRTGDSGFLKDGDQLFLTGRCASLFMHHGRLICPFLFESWLQQLSGVTIGTVLSHQGKMLFCIELKPNADAEQIKQAIKALDILDVEIRVIPKIPRDPRHHSKIDYGKLLEA